MTAYYAPEAGESRGARRKPGVRCSVSGGRREVFGVRLSVVGVKRRKRAWVGRVGLRAGGRAGPRRPAADWLPGHPASLLSVRCLSVLSALCGARKAAKKAEESVSKNEGACRKMTEFAHEGMEAVSSTLEVTCVYCCPGGRISGPGARGRQDKRSRVSGVRCWGSGVWGAGRRGRGREGRGG